MTKRTIPEIRQRMFELSNELALLSNRQIEIAVELEELANETYRRTYERAPVTSRRITNEVRLSVVKMATDYPELSHQAIAEVHNINLGRVSEILHGKR